MGETSPRVDRLKRDLQATGAGAVEAFWAELAATGTPLIEPLDEARCLVTFAWRGEAGATSVHWGVDLALDRLGGTDLWLGTTVAPANLRSLYYFGHDHAEELPRTRDPGPTHIDLLNRQPFHFPRDPVDPTDGDSWASLLELPAAPPEPWLAPVPAEEGGRTVDAYLASTAFGTQRHVVVHLPAGVSSQGLPVLVVFDGNHAQSVLHIPTTVDNLVAAGQVPPLVTIFVYSPDETRNSELQPDSPIVPFVADELLPWVRSEYGVTDDPARTVIAGVSRGGLAAAAVALLRPTAAAVVIAQSGSFWWPSPDEGEPEWLTREFERRPVHPLRFYLDVGDRETGPGPGGAPSQVDVNRRLRDVLTDRGYSVHYVEYVGAHDYVNWRRTFADGLVALIGSSVVADSRR